MEELVNQHGVRRGRFGNIIVGYLGLGLGGGVGGD